jgi:hypothetical protein
MNGFEANKFDSIDFDEIDVPKLNKLRYSAIRFLQHFAGKKMGARPAVQRFFDHLYKQSERSLLKHFEGYAEGRFVDIEEVTHISPEDFHRNYLSQARPLVIRGAAKEWTCFQKWTPEFFRDTYGDDEIVLTSDHTANADDSPGHRITLREIVNSLHDADISKYAHCVPILAYHPELFDDLDADWLAKRIDKRGTVKLWGEKQRGTSLRSQLFLSRQGAKTEVHCALTNNMFINVYGREQWYLISPQYNPLIYSPVNWGPGLYGTALTPEAPDFRRFPLQRYISGYRFTLEPGDVLFNPPFWWHHVRNVTSCISIGIRWYSFANAMKASKTQNILAFLATSPSLYSAARNSVEYWKRLEQRKKLKAAA